MTETTPESKANKWRRRFFLVLVAWILTSVLMSFSPVRGFIARPLYVHDIDAAGEVAYVMADGPAYWERLRAASDLYHWDRIERILILDETESAGYNFVRHQSDSRKQRALDYLLLFGVPEDRVEWVPLNHSTRLGSLSESRGVAEKYPDLKSIVIVTSAPHTRRSRLCFQRSLPTHVTIRVYAATAPAQSTEIESPLWIEYVKLVVYYFAA